VIAALAAFLWVTGKERAHREKLDLRLLELGHADQVGTPPGLQWVGGDKD
jgi:hypothetical protein